MQLLILLQLRVFLWLIYWTCVPTALVLFIDNNLPMDILCLWWYPKNNKFKVWNERNQSFSFNLFLLWFILGALNLDMYTKLLYLIILKFQPHQLFIHSLVFLWLFFWFYRKFILQHPFNWRYWGNFEISPSFCEKFLHTFLY